MGRWEMMHKLTIGFLDHEMLARRQLRVLRPLKSDIRAVLEQLRKTVPNTLSDDSVEITSDHIQCIWYTPRVNRAAVQLALAALRLGYDVAEVGRARIVDSEELTASLGTTPPGT